ncbi:Symplekin tight junction protein C terminal-domain-containing protein [Haematococcus lacustris]
MLRRPLGAGGESSRRPPLGQPTLPSDLPASAAAQQLVGDAGAGAAAAAGGQASEGGRGLAQALAKALSLASTEEAARHCELYTTLCVRRPELLGGLLTTYAAAPGPVRAALLAASEGLARALGCSNPQLLAAVRHPPPGSEALVTQLVEVVVSGLLPSEALVAAVRQRVADSGDVALLAPLVGALDKAELLALLPRLLQVGGLALKGLYRKLTCAPSTAGEPVFSPAELLVALHGLDPARDGLAPRTLMAAVDAALHAPDIFPQQAVAQALQQMECCTPLPLLFMRTTITSLKAAPRLRPFIADLLARLISKQLPAPVLERALGLGPSDPGEPVLKQTTAVQLAAWSSSPDCKLQVVHSVATLLDRIMQAHKAREAAADAATAEVAEAVARAEAAMARAAAQPAVVKTESPAAEGTGTEAAAESEDGDAEAAQVAATAEPEGASPSRRVDEFDLDFEQLAEEENGGEGDQEMAGA